MSTAWEEGPDDARIILVGEAPSWAEVQEQRPFVGPAGGLLERCLHAAQIARAETYIVNCFPEPVFKPKDDASRIYAADKTTLLWTSGKGFTPAGQSLVAPVLARLHDHRDGNVICALGGVASSLALGDTRSITKWRGSILAGIEGRKVIPTIHPAFCLRGAYESRYLLVSDLKKVKANADFAELRLPRRRLIVDPSHDDCVTFLRRVLDSNAVDTDIEILGGQVDCFSLAVDPSEAISIPLLDSDWSHRWSLEEEREIWSLYAQILASPYIAKVNQNITFDLATLMQLNNLVPQGPLHDPMIAWSIMYPFLKKNLATIASCMTDEPFWKDDGDLGDTPNVDDFVRRWEYNARDSAVSLEAWQKLMPLVDENGYRSTYDRTIASLPSLIYMMNHGVRVDQDALQHTREESERRLEQVLAKLAETTGRPIITEAPKTAKAKRAAAGSLNVNSPAQVAHYLYTEKRLKPYVNAVGKPSVDDKALSRIIRRDGLPEARLLQEYRSLSKMQGTYFDVDTDADDRVRASWNPRGTYYGRFSSQKTVLGRGFNLQNQPQEMRDFLVSDFT